LIKRQALTIHLHSFKVVNGFHALLFIFEPSAPA
jgi:hypothetical protein